MPENIPIILSQATVDELRKIDAALAVTIKNFQATVEQANLVARALMRATPREFLQGMKDSNALQKELIRLTKEIEKLKQQLNRTLQTEINNRRALANADAAEARAIRERLNQQRAELMLRRQQELALRRSRQGLDDETSAYKRLQREVNSNKSKARDFGAELLYLARRLKNGEISQREYNRELKTLSIQYRNAVRESQRLDSQLRKINNTVNGTTKQTSFLNNGVLNLLKGLGLFSVVDNIASSFYRLGQDFVKTSIKLDTLHLTQKAVFKTQEEVGKQNDYLREVADRYGLKLVDLTESYSKFSAASRGTIIEGQKTKDVFEAVSKTSAILGVSADDTRGIFKALEQMMSKGKIQAEELRGQLGDRMAGAFRLFADAMGISTGELDKLLKKGGVITDQVLPKFAEQLNKKYKLEIGEDIETKQASLNRMSNAWLEFVDGVEQRSGTVTKGIGGVTSAISNLLEALTPSLKVTVIQQEQAQLNLLGIELRKNFKDEKKRKEIIDEMIQLNPFFLSGLDKEKVTLEDISIRLGEVNKQYIAKIALQKQDEKIKELVSDQADAYAQVADVFSRYAVEFTSFNAKTKKAIEDYSIGAISYKKANEIIRSSNTFGSLSFTYAERMVSQMSRSIEGASLNFQGYNRGVKGNEEALKGAKMETDNLLNYFNRMIGVNGQLINSNGLLATSYDELGNAMKNQTRADNEELEAAKKRGIKLLLIRNVWRQQNAKGNWFTTDKKETDGWFNENGKLVNRTQKPDGAGDKDYLKQLEIEKDTELAINETSYTIGKKSETDYVKTILAITRNFLVKKINFLKNGTFDEKKQAAQAKLELAKLERETQEKIMEIRINFVDAWRDNELANAKERQVLGEVTEKQYWETYIEIQKQYRIKMQSLINLSDSKKLKLDAKSRKKAFENIEKANKEIFDYEKTRLEAFYKMRSEVIERKLEDINNDEYLMEVDKINERNKLYNEQIADTAKFYHDLLVQAKMYSIEYYSIMAKNADDIGRLQDKQSKNSGNLPGAVKADREYLQNIDDSYRNANSAKEREDILSNSKLSKKQKEYLLSLKEKEQNLQNLNIEKQRNEEIKKTLFNKSYSEKLTKEEEEDLANATSQVASMNEEIAKTNQEIKELNFDYLADSLSLITDQVKSGLTDLGLNKIASQFDSMFEDIINGTMTWEKKMILAASAIADALTMISNTQRDNTIAALEEQLKYSQEASEQEIGFIDSRLDYLNGLEDATTEQIQERNRLEDEARGMREQQAMREKMIAKQKAKAQQKADAEQALISSGVAAVNSYASLASIPVIGPALGLKAAIAALGFGVLQAGFIMTKNPVPEYFVGRSGGEAEWAWTQERGREIITDKKGNIKSLGTDSGPQMTWLEKGDSVKTASESRKIFEQNLKIPEIDHRKLLYDSLITPSVIIPRQEDHSQKIIDGVGKELERVFGKFDKTNVYENEDGDIVIERGSRIPEIRKKKKPKPTTIIITKSNVRD